MDRGRGASIVNQEGELGSCGITQKPRIAYLKERGSGQWRPTLAEQSLKKRLKETLSLATGGPWKENFQYRREGRS